MAEGAAVLVWEHILPVPADDGLRIAPEPDVNDVGRRAFIPVRAHDPAIPPSPRRSGCDERRPLAPTSAMYD